MGTRYFYYLLGFGVIISLMQECGKPIPFTAKLCAKQQEQSICINSMTASSICTLPGIDNRIWQQARLDNPDPDRFIPVPMIGFTELYDRLKQQEQQTGLHQSRLDVSIFITELFVTAFYLFSFTPIWFLCS